MSRYIDADYLSEEFDNRCPGDCACCKENINSKSGCKVIDDTPTADVVEVVRCKDCRWGKESCGNIECFADTNMPPEYHGYDWFCPNGEKR